MPPQHLLHEFCSAVHEQHQGTPRVLLVCVPPFPSSKSPFTQNTDSDRPCCSRRVPLRAESRQPARDARPSRRGVRAVDRAALARVWFRGRAARVQAGAVAVRAPVLGLRPARLARVARLLARRDPRGLEPDQEEAGDRGAGLGGRVGQGVGRAGQDVLGAVPEPERLGHCRPVSGPVSQYGCLPRLRQGEFPP